MRRTPSMMVAGGVLGVVALGACSGGTGASSAGGGGGDGSGSSVGSIKLVAAEYSKDHTAAFWKQFAKKYKDKTGITLDVQVVSWDSIDQTSSTMVQNNTPPDILNLNAFASYARDGLLYGADEVLSDEVKSDILDSFVDSGTYDGTMYGFPDLASARAFFYNTKLFSQAGISTPPTTWDELETDAKKIEDLGGQTIGYAMPLGPEEAQGEFSMWTFNNGGAWKDGDQWVIDSPTNVETLSFMKKLAVTDGVTQNNPARTNRAQAFDLFKSGNVGMVVGFSPLAQTLDEEDKVDYGVAPMPTGDGKAPRTLGVTDYLMAFKKKGNKEAVKAFYDLYYQKDEVNTFIEKEGFLPVTKSGLDYFSKDEDLKVYLDTLPNVRLTPTDDPAWDRVKLAVQQNIGAAVRSDGDPKAVLGKLQQTATSGS